MLPEPKQLTLQTLTHRLERAQRRLETARRVEARYPWYRLAALIVGLVAAYLGFRLLPLAGAWFVAGAALLGFAWVAALHRGVIERMSRLEAFTRLLSAHTARLKLDWPGIPAATEVPVPAAHPFAMDLDITGPDSLHQLLDTAVSLGGSLHLANWLLQSTPQPQQITRHQALVSELLQHPAFRLRLELDGMVAVGSSPAGPQPAASSDGAPPRGRWDGSALLTWLAKRQSAQSLAPVLIILSLLAAANIILFSLDALGKLPALWIGTFAVYFALQAYRFRESSEVFDEAYSLSRQLNQLRLILTGLETYPYAPGSRLRELCAPFWQGPVRPSVALRQISRIATAASLRNNPFFSLLFNIIVPWDMFFAYQLERYKRRLSGLLPAWLETWYALEAFCALANFAALNPETTFPGIKDGGVITKQAAQPGQNPVFSARAMGHPLIPAGARVSNDFTIQQLGQVIVITGSNMSGKSTFLRTVGVNLALAYAGGTVTAEALHTLPFCLFTSMTLADSLNEGVSFFYAEVRRLKALLDQLNADSPYPLLFLIDEIFRGTNNRERQAGSRAYTEALAGKYGVGLISTHDLELAHLADSIPAVSNFHFREDIHDGQMVFDYKVRPGASPTTNALRIMALAGLPVPFSQDPPQGKNSS